MANPPELRKALFFYRLVVLILLAALCFVLLRPVPPDHGPDGGQVPDSPPGSPNPPASSSPPAPSAKELVVLDLLDHFGQLSQLPGDNPDLSERYLRNQKASVHMHVIGRGQMCPLHIHRVAEEMTVIVAGHPTVSHVYAEAGHPVRHSGEQRPGNVIMTPVFCGHEWRNLDLNNSQGNLVYAMPTFDGNLYVTPDDTRLLKGKAPTLLDPLAELARFQNSRSGSEVKVLPIMHGCARLVLVRDRFKLDHDPASGATVCHVLAGSGTLMPRKIQLKEQYLLLIGTANDLIVEADPKHPLAMILFQPGKGTSP